MRLLHVFAMLVLLSSLGCQANDESPCVSVAEGVYGWTGDFVAEPGGGFEGHSMSVAWLAEDRDGDQVPTAVTVSDRSGFFEMAVPAGVGVLCVGTGDLSNFHVAWADEDCFTVDVQGLASWSYVTDIGIGAWIGDYGDEIALCE